jgi:hypothetical protein
MGDVERFGGVRLCCHIPNASFQEPNTGNASKQQLQYLQLLGYTHYLGIIAY